MIFAENNMPVVAEGFSGVVTSVDKLEYYFIFYAIGTGVDTELSIKTALTRISNFDLINGLEHMKPLRYANSSSQYKPRSALQGVGLGLVSVWVG